MRKGFGMPRHGRFWGRQPTVSARRAYRFLPTAARPNDFAVITAAGFVIAVIPLVFRADLLAIFSFGRDSEIDQEPRQVGSNPCPPAIRVLGVPAHVTDLRTSLPSWPLRYRKW